MTTPPPTGNGAAPAWLPDEETLSRMAGEFFRALPGQPADTEAPTPAFDGRPEWPTPTGLPLADSSPTAPSGPSAAQSAPAVPTGPPVPGPFPAT
ncbi:hypothetical protein R6V09_46615, partial [Streptomyces sp. W16]|nr:hypothetical protein [Streptomyces sp. W16]